MWMFVPDRNGRALRLGIDEAWAQTVTDAFGGIIQQSKQRSSSDGMTVLAKTGPVKGMFGRSKGNDIIEAYRFTKDHAKSVAIKSARLAVPIWERIAVTDKLQQALDVAAMSEASPADYLAAKEIIQEQCTRPAEEIADGAASYVAQSVESALLTAASGDDALAVRAAAYTIAYAIQAAKRENERVHEAVSSGIEGYLEQLVPQLPRVPF
jgi:hypothetical protein